MSAIHLYRGIQEWGSTMGQNPKMSRSTSDGNVLINSVREAVLPGEPESEPEQNIRNLKQVERDRLIIDQALSGAEGGRSFERAW